VDEDGILPYFSNLVQATLIESSATPFVMAHTIPFHEIQAHVALHIWPHSIKISPGKSEPYDITNDMFCNSQIISQKCPSKPSSEENEASLLVMEHHLFDRLQDSTKLQRRALYYMLHHVLEDYHFYLSSNSKGNTKPLYNRFPKNNTTEQPSLNSTSDSKENTKTSSPEVTLKQESPKSAFESDQNAVSYSDANSTPPSPKNHSNNKVLTPRLTMTKAPYAQSE
jgi:hypothetical protein